MKPIPHSKRDRTTNQFHPATSPKHSHEGEEIQYTSSSLYDLKIDVLEITDIEREFELVCARLKLVSKNAKDPITASLPTGPGLSAQETVSLLVNAHLYEDAIHISKIFDLDKTPIVEGLASRCVTLARAKATERDAAWDWLSENNQASADLRTGSAVEAAWKLLQDILLRLEIKGQSSLFKAVVKRIFTHGATLPAWLIHEYKEVFCFIPAVHYIACLSIRVSFVLLEFFSSSNCREIHPNSFDCIMSMVIWRMLPIWPWN